MTEIENILSKRYYHKIDYSKVFQINTFDFVYDFFEKNHPRKTKSFFWKGFGKTYFLQKNGFPEKTNIFKKIFAERDH